jgi:hypothetical protein
LALRLKRRFILEVKGYRRVAVAIEVQGDKVAEVTTEGG